MSEQIQKIAERINQLQDELEQAFDQRREQFSFTVKNRKVKFQASTIRWQKQFKQLLIKYVFTARLLNIASAPVIYSLIVPFVIIDLWISLYQVICFPIYKMEKVRRRDYMVFDRHHLGYLNYLEKLNCAYCSYGNGLLAYGLEVASRTEAYWCPVKHASKLPSYHKWYGDFSDYGDAENYQKDRERNMGSVRKK